MILKLAGYLLILFLAIMVGVFFQNHTGYVLFAYNQWTLETSLWFFVMLIGVLFCVFHGVLNVARYFRSSARDFRLWRKNKSHQQAHNLTEAGLLAFYEADFRTAEKFLILGAPRSHVAVVNYLAAARAAQVQSRFAERDLYLQKAAEHAEGEEVAVDITKAELLLAHHELVEAQKILEHLREQHPRHPYILKLQARVYHELGDWEKLPFLLERLEKYRALETEDLRKLTVEVYQHLLEKSALTPESLVAYWRTLPKALKAHPELVYLYAEQLRKFHLEVATEELLTSFLKRSYDAKLVALYAKLSIVTLKSSEKLLRDWQAEPEVLLALAHIAYAQGAWESARHYAERALGVAVSSAAYALLAASARQLGDVASAEKYSDLLQHIWVD